ncbi:serine/threonine-protein phosphatase 6 regulatory ankyrin repeat subunit A-like isoform X2 [Corticium candelabrum]|uniref:serine/threonine-protein phosphatase 6 regulatory ankyrin repeat subunit A-like isoform X2 n=1 Tax=Corticium candelabrum TaxID=121492 RepID=UPI002E2529B4|nr:serine/threonine-protein phosphatase 6 regulatory ankyrin repeat subunit A-like isoform X2 [Corticium candelabrum]
MEDARIVDAARSGRIGLVHSLLEDGVSVNSKNATGETALHVACFYNRSDVLNVLLEAGASVNALTRSRYTPLHYAADSGSLDAEDLRLLLLAGSVVTARDSQGNTPLHTSVRMGRVSTFKLLAEKEALESVKELSGCTRFLTEGNNAGESPLSLVHKRYGGRELALWTEDLLQRIRVS